MCLKGPQPHHADKMRGEACTEAGLESGLVRSSETTNNLGRTSSVLLGLSHRTSTPTAQTCVCRRLDKVCVKV